MRRLAIAITLSIAAGCGTPPEATDGRDWVEDLQPVLAENGLVWERMLRTAADVHEGKGDADVTALAWNQDLVPLVEHVRDEAALIQPPNAWATDHAAIVAVWAARAEAYRDLSVALRQGDTERWRNARPRADKAKLDEEAWFRTTNDKLRTLGITLDQYPTGVGTR